jgi:hypothetical protein
MPSLGNHKPSGAFAGFDDQFGLVQVDGAAFIAEHEVQSAGSIRVNFVLYGASD